VLDIEGVDCIEEELIVPELELVLNAELDPLVDVEMVLPAAL
jgi:hypothetical protein